MAKEAVPDHGPLTAAWSNDIGTRVVAVGAGGGVFERQSALGEKEGRWRVVSSGTDAELLGVAGGDGPSLRTIETRIFAVGSRGTLLDCTGDKCVRVTSSVEEDLHAVAIAGGQAFLVGDRGALLHVRANPGHRFDKREPELAVQRVEINASADLGSVAVRCNDHDQCLTIAVGGSGTIVEGAGEGRCWDGSTLSGSHSDCRWAWSLRPSPTKVALVRVRFEAELANVLASDGSRLTRSTAGDWVVDAEKDSIPSATLPFIAPVHVVRTKLWRTREDESDALVSLGVTPRVLVRNTWIPLHVDMPVAATTSTKHNEFVYLLSGAGDLYLAQ
jgi:hypothetical protein